MNRSRAAWTKHITGEVKKHKFSAVKTDGYDSKGESRLAQEMQLRIRAGELLEVIEQAPFPLFGLRGTRVCTHWADFLLIYRDGHPEVEEFKGVQTRAYRIKYKLFLDNYPGINYVIRRKA